MLPLVAIIMLAKCQSNPKQVWKSAAPSCQVCSSWHVFDHPHSLTCFWVLFCEDILYTLCTTLCLLWTRYTYWMFRCFKESMPLRYRVINQCLSYFHTDSAGELHRLPCSPANQWIFGQTIAGYITTTNSRVWPRGQLSEFISQQFLEARGNQKNQQPVTGACVAGWTLWGTGKR